ncbi:MAG: hypothetical protein KDA45_07955, partial [Planctomycetales bacterium]|nr:hypothetical protein [Planctomycetales bacterium]
TPQSTTPQSTTPQPLTQQPAASKPRTSLDEQRLNLGGPALNNLAEREQVVLANKAMKAQQHASQRVGPGDYQAALTSAAPSPAAKPASGKPGAGTTPRKRSVFDDDLPELAELTHSNRRQVDAETLLSSYAAEESPAKPRTGKSATPSASPQRTPATRPTAASTAHRPPPSNHPPTKPRRNGAAQGGPPPLLAAGKKQGAPEYRITCKTCGTPQYVALSAKGMRIKCPDCFSQFKVPPPPEGWKPPQASVKPSAAAGMSFAEAEELHQAQMQAKRRARTSRLLEQAEQEVAGSELDRRYDDDFDTATFVQRTFGFFKDPVAMAHVFGFAIIFAGVFALGQFGANSTANDHFSRGSLLLAVIGAPMAALLFALPMLSCGMALLESVANRQRRVADWPGFNLFENAGDMVAISAALLGSMIPGYMLGSWLGGEAEGAGRIQIAGMMLSSFALFPVFLLSMLDNGSIFAPLSQSIVRSLTEAAEAWAGYYLKTAVAFSFVMLLWLLLLGKSEGLASIAGLLLPLLVFFTCQQIGALADDIGEHLSFEIALPEEAEGEPPAS